MRVLAQDCPDQPQFYSANNNGLIVVTYHYDGTPAVIDPMLSFVPPECTYDVTYSCRNLDVN